MYSVSALYPKERREWTYEDMFKGEGDMRKKVERSKRFFGEQQPRGGRREITAS
jgi:hypothetical protein